MSIYTPFWARPEYDKSQPILMYGFGLFGTYYLKRLHAEGVKIKAIFDANPELHDTEVVGIPILSPEKISEFSRDYVVFIAVLGYKYTLTKMFRELGFTHIFNEYEPEIKHIESLVLNKFQHKAIIEKNASKIEEARKLFHEPKSLEIFDAALDAWGSGNWERLEAQFQPEVILPDDIYDKNAQEVLVECGAYEGGGVYSFIHQSGHKYGFIYAFEPSELEFAICSRSFRLNRIPNIELHRLAVCDIDGTITFSDGDNSHQGAKILEEGSGIKIPSTRLDTFFSQPNKKTPTLIRMDIEGAEVSALYGAKSLIYNHMPNLAISAYHRLEDYWEVPLTIAKLSKHPGYDIYLRHFRCYYDTICFAKSKA